MKLIYIANARIPTEKAHGIQIMKMCEAFARNNCQVELIVPRRINKIKDNPFDYYGVEKNFKITKLPCLDLIPFGLGNFGFWVQTISFLIFARIYLLFKKYDILYTREQFTGLFFKDFVLEIHNPLPKEIKSVHKTIWRKAHALVVSTSFIKNKLVEVKISADKILIAPNGVDIEKFKKIKADLRRLCLGKGVNMEIHANYPRVSAYSEENNQHVSACIKEKAREKLNLPQDKILIGYVGMFKTMEMSKGIDLAIGALKNLPRNIILVLVGGNKADIDEYQNFASSLGLKDKVIFTGRVRHELIPYYLKAFDILIAPFPDIEDYRFYMSPLKLFEYMASGIPIVATNLPSIREILNENNAVLVEPNNPEKLAEGIKKVLQDKELSAKISKQAFQDVQQYTWQKRAEKILEFII